jgi:hypothetical protein
MSAFFFLITTLLTEWNDNFLRDAVNFIEEQSIIMVKIVTTVIYVIIIPKPHVLVTTSFYKGSSESRVMAA